MLSARVFFQTTRLSKTSLAHITFVRFLVRVNAHVDLQITWCTKTLLAHIAFIRSLVRVNTHMSRQLGWCYKHLLADIALALPSLSLPSLRRRRLFFSYLISLRIIRYPQTQQHRSSFSSLSLFYSLLLRNTRNHHRVRVFRSFRMFILSSRWRYIWVMWGKQKSTSFPRFFAKKFVIKYELLHSMLPLL